MENKTVIVIGAVNLDICGRPNNVPTLCDSNPGKISFSVGGVGNNIARDLALLGLNVRICAAIGDDVYADVVCADCEKHGLDMSLSLKVPGGRTSSYLYVTDEKGEMHVGIADMDINENVDDKYLAGILDELNRADAVVIDGNMSENTARFVAENVTVPIYADPVSGVKGKKLKPALPYLRAFKPNALEAMILTGENTPEAAAKKLLSLGVGRVLVSLGADGMLAAEGDTIIKLPCEKLNIVSTTGCGDCAAAAMIWADLFGYDLKTTAQAAQRAAAVTAECDFAVNDKLTAELII